MVVEKIQESRHTYGRRLASIVRNTGLQVTEKLRGKIKWLCKQFIDKHGEIRLLNSKYQTSLVLIILSRVLQMQLVSAIGL